MFGLRTRKERNPLRVEKKERILSQSLRSFARTAKGKNSSNRVQNRQLKSWTRTDAVPSLPSFVRTFDRSDAVFARPLTPLFKGFQNAAAAATAPGRAPH